MKNFGASQEEDKKSSGTSESVVGSTEGGLNSEVMGDTELLNIASRGFRWVLGESWGRRLRLSSNAGSILVGAGGSSTPMACIARHAKHRESSSIAKRYMGTVRIIQVPIEELGGRGSRVSKW